MERRDDYVLVKDGVGVDVAEDLVEDLVGEGLEGHCGCWWRGSASGGEVLRVRKGDFLISGSLGGLMVSI